MRQADSRFDPPGEIGCYRKLTFLSVEVAYIAEALIYAEELLKDYHVGAAAGRG
jgi:hypothetical protein